MQTMGDHFLDVLDNGEAESMAVPYDKRIGALTVICSLEFREPGDCLEMPFAIRKCSPLTKLFEYLRLQVCRRCSGGSFFEASCMFSEPRRLKTSHGSDCSTLEEVPRLG